MDLIKVISGLAVFLMGVGVSSLIAQHHHHTHHREGEFDLQTDTVSQTVLWDDVAADLRQEFDSVFTSNLGKPSEMDRVYDAFLDQIPAKTMLEFLANRYSYCHPMAHELGVAVYRYFGDLGAAIYECGDGCSSACMHGAVREAFGNATVKDIIASVDSVCAIDGMAEINRPGNCAHALGHALMLATGDSLGPSLDGCSKFPGRSLKHYCATGVFMEYGADRSSRAKPTDSGEFVSRQPCDQYTDFAAACYRYVVPRIRRSLHTMDPAVLASECRKLPGHEQLGCFRGIGVTFAGFVRSDPKRIHDVCSDTNPDNRLVCIDALVEQTAYSRREEANLICEELDGEAKQVCTAALTGRYELYKPIMDVYLGSDD